MSRCAGWYWCSVRYARWVFLSRASTVEARERARVAALQRQDTFNASIAGELSRRACQRQKHMAMHEEEMKKTRMMKRAAAALAREEEARAKAAAAAAGAMTTTQNGGGGGGGGSASDIPGLATSSDNPLLNPPRYVPPPNHGGAGGLDMYDLRLFVHETAEARDAGMGWNQCRQENVTWKRVTDGRGAGGAGGREGFVRPTSSMYHTHSILKL